MLEAGRPLRYLVSVDYAGDSAGPHYEVTFDPRAGRWLGNPELAVTVTDLSTGESVATGHDRAAFTVFWSTDCDDPASCSRAYAIDLELTAGREAEIDWTVRGWYFLESQDTGADSDEMDTADTDEGPATATVTITGPE